ncbi:MAG TPA: metalloregulator ArsR/SmtB family transcription factor [Rhizobacter sp.]|nr:metalloregulator ArsR/SmtB family transcription factor [Rhizobacter sp.]
MTQEALNAVFSALADPTRRAILARLTEGDASVGELAAPFDLSLPTVSRHIDVLEGAGLVVRERDAQWRRCHFQREPLMQANEWIGRYVAFWDGRLDALAELVESLPAKKTARANKSALRKPGQPRKPRKEPR